MKMTVNHIGLGRISRWLIVAGLLLVAGACATPQVIYTPGPHKPAPPVDKRIPGEPAKQPASSPYAVFGKRYVPLPDAAGFVQNGKASWYGGKFHGRRTASGEIYNKYKLTAAHKTLPLGTYVKVINRENNRSVVVKVNDRGPFVSGRIIDLSYAAARQLDMLQTGTASVKIIALADKSSAPSVARPSAQPAKMPVSAPPVAGAKKGTAANSGGTGFSFQVGSFSQRANAERLKTELDQMYKNVHIVAYTEGGTTFYRVRLGHYATREDIEHDRQRLIEAGFENVRIVTE